MARSLLLPARVEGQPAVTIVLTVAVTPSWTSIVTMWVPVVRIGCSSCTLRRSSFIPRACLIASTMSCAVTEPNRRPSSPAGWGIVSNLRQKNPRRPTWEDQSKVTLHDYGTLIQIDRNLPLGSSGGALLNLQGELVGLITSLAGVTGDGGGAYAVPLDAAMIRIVRVLEKGQEVEYGFLGVQFDPSNFPGARHLPRGSGWS